MRGAIGPKTVAGERFASFGEGSVIAFPTSTLYGERAIHIGRDTMIGPWCTIAAGYAPDQSSLAPRTLVIGDRSVIGMRSGIVAHESIEIGDDVWFGQEIYVTDANHGYQDPTTPIGKQLGAHAAVRIGDGTWIGHGSVVLPGTMIGRNVVIAAGSVVRGEFPDHSVIGGVPAKVIRRFEPGVGWVRPTGDLSDAKPIEAPLDIEALARDLELLEELGADATEETIAAARLRQARASA